MSDDKGTNARSAKRVDEFVGERIRQRRATLGMTQEDLAERLGISYQQIQKYETGANRVSASRLYHIARSLEVDVAYMFEGLDAIDIDAERQGMDHGGRNRGVIEIAQNFSAIPDPAVKGAIASLLKALAKGTDADNGNTG